MALLKTKLPADTEESQVRMGFGEHLEEFRRRLIYALLGSLFGIALCLYYVGHIIAFLVRPLQVALHLAHFPVTFSSTGPAEVLMLYLSVGIKTGLIFCAPWIIYQLWLFVAAGLYARERRIIYRYIGPSVLLFFAGIAFFFFLILPMSLHFFFTYSMNTNLGSAQPNAFENKIWHTSEHQQDISKLPDGNQVIFPPIPIVKSDPTTVPPDRLAIWYNAVEGTLKANIDGQTMTFIMHQENSLFTQWSSLKEYLGFVTFSSLVFGLAFELPMVMLVLAQVGIVDAAAFRKARRYAYFGLAVLSAVAAPSTDVFTMISLMIPMIGLYELGVLLAAIVGKKRDKEFADDT